jgi:hypothetical protein
MNPKMKTQTTTMATSIITTGTKKGVVMYMMMTVICLKRTQDKTLAERMKKSLLLKLLTKKEK